MTALKSLLPNATESQAWSKPTIYKRNEVIVMAGSTVCDLLYIESGAVRIYIIDGDHEQTIRFGYEGEIVTALDCFLTGQQTQLQMESLRKTTIRKLPNQVLRKAISGSSKLTSEWIKVL